MINALLRSVAVVVSAGFLMNAPAWAETVSYKADLTGAAETPANASKGQGTVRGEFDTGKRTLAWTVTYSDLSGPVTAAHFHGPAKEGAKAPPVIPLKGEMTSPIKGSATLTEKQAAELEGGLLYFNLHTAKFPDGEVRGQLVK